ncbi:MAG: glucose-1-phosphate cytidylyltransferase [Candidatus Micrarchaeia archaeon]
MEDLKNWPVIILCGGQGTRLKEETEFRPKPMVQIGGTPILEHIMRTYAHFGCRKFILCLGYKGEMIKQHFLLRDMAPGDLTINLKDKNHSHAYKFGSGEDWEITFADTGLNTSTGARIKKIEKYVKNDNFFVTYGDGVSDINISNLAKFHLEQGTHATLTGVRPPSRFGLLELEGNKVKKFREKPLIDEHVNGGYYVFNKAVFAHLSEDDSCTLEKEPLQNLVSNNQLSIYKHDGFWHMMDTYKDYLDLNAIWDSNNAKWKV